MLLKYSQLLEKKCVSRRIFGDEIDRIREVNYLTGEVIREREAFYNFPSFALRYS